MKKFIRKFKLALAKMETNKEPSFPYKYLFKEVSPRTLARKKREGLCKHWGCQNFTRRPTARDCETCHSRKKRIKNPVRYAFQQVKRSADMRGIPFNLTFEEFQEFDKQTGYVNSKGTGTESLTIDRIDPSKGYEVGNIRALNFADNCSRKLEGMTMPHEPIAKAMALVAKETNWHKFKKLAAETLYQVEILQAQEEGGFQTPEENCPF